MIVVYYIAIYHKINELPNGHIWIYFYWLHTRNFERPMVAKTHIALARRGMNVYAKPAYAALAL